MKNLLVIIMLTISISSAQGIEFFSTAYIESYRTDLHTTMVSPNIYFKLGRLEGYGFCDQYFEPPKFYHAEFMLTFTPFKTKYLDRISIIAERRWDKSARDENSLGLRLKLW